MATRQEIEKIRLSVNDPPDILEIITIENKNELPQEPKSQAAYFDQSRGEYWTREDGGEFEIAKLNISDAAIAIEIDEVGAKLARCRAFEIMAEKIGGKMNVVRSQVGTDSTQYQDIKNVYAYYKDLAKTCKDNIPDDGQKSDTPKSGRYRSMKSPVIAGGNL